MGKRGEGGGRDAGGVSKREKEQCWGEEFRVNLSSAHRHRSHNFFMAPLYFLFPSTIHMIFK